MNKALKFMAMQFMGPLRTRVPRSMRPSLVVSACCSLAGLACSGGDDAVPGETGSSTTAGMTTSGLTSGNGASVGSSTGTGVVTTTAGVATTTAGVVTSTAGVVTTTAGVVTTTAGVVTTTTAGTTAGTTGAGGATSSTTDASTTGVGGATTASTTATNTTGAPLGECDPYVWPGYTPDLNWTFESTNIDPSQFTVYQGCDANVVAGTRTSGWWSFIWGNNRNPSITDQQIQTVLDGLNEDLGYIRDVMGWPPDDMAQDGYFSSVYLYGSGLCTDNASNTEQGGWQSGIGPYAMVLLSWAPIVNYDRGGITHEAIHAMVQGAPGGDNKAHWFNEGGNTWIQQQLYARRDGSYGVGFLDGAPFIAPHQPIECYSGWLLDGSFGGPDAEGVGDCNWRRYLGGTQYNSVFSHFLALYVSPGANAWVWQQANPRNILETLSTGLGDAQTRHLVMEYRARQALVDFGPWRDTLIDQINGEWGSTINRECGTGDNPPNYTASAYAPTTTNGTTITPDDITLPGWSGANQIPLNVSGSEVRLNFQPAGANMRLQVAYWAEDGTAVYSQPVESGELCLRLDKAPKDGVVTAVVSNTDYVFTGDSMRFDKYDYAVEMVAGATSTADRSTRWFLND